MKKLEQLWYILVLLILCSLVLFPVLPSPVAHAEEPYDQLELWDTIVLEDGTEATYIGKTASGKYRFVTIFDAPTYLADLTTRIEPNWSYDHDKGEWVAGPNLFEAIVKGGKVTVWKDGEKMSWEPTILVGTKDTKPVSADAILLSVDPINKNYWGNTLEWDFGVAKRHLRIIEGMLLEYFIFEANPNADVQIKSNLYKDVNFVWDRPPFAYDANGEPIEISSDKVVLASEFNRADITYPVTIDPTSTFTTSSSDVWIYQTMATYSPTHDATTGLLATGDDKLGLGQNFGGSSYTVRRISVFFDTSGLPDDAIIDTATPKLYGSVDGSTTDFNLQVQSGMPTYPHDPPVVGDYYYTHYSDNGGTFNTSGFSTSSYNEVALNATGKSWINKTGTTKFMLRSDRDVGNITPTGNEYIYFWSYEKGDGYWPQLVIVYHAPSVPTVTTKPTTDIAITTATARGYLDSDGGEPCQIRWEYDTDSGVPYASNTGWLGTNYTTGQSPYTTLSDLAVDTLHYIRIQAKNSVGTINGTELSFTTLASLNPPTNMTAIARSGTELSIRWTPGIGSSQTLVRWKLGNYPSTTTDGNVATNTTLSSYLLEDMTSGTTVYLKAWGYDGGSFSSANITEMATMLAEAIPGESVVGAPQMPPGFFDPPSLDNLTNLPFYDLFNRGADGMGMPRTTLWIILGMGLVMALGAAFYMMTKSPMFALLGPLLGFAALWQTGLLPGWIPVVYGMLAGFLFVLMPKGAS